ncbi:response regulator [bacterium]|nr:response regulator [bacterium]
MNDEDALRYESYRELARTTPATVPVYPALVVGCALASSFAREHQQTVFSLFLATGLAGSVRFWAARRLLSCSDTVPPLLIWGYRLAALTVGLSWGLFNALSVYWYRTGWASQLAMVVTVGLTAGATSTLASDLGLFRVYAAVMLLPGTLLLAALGGQEALSSLPLFVFLLFIAATGRQHNQRYWKSIRSEQLLRRQRAELEEANRAKSVFLATMSHEIRTPMNAVMGMTELLLDSPLKPEQREWVQSLRGGSETLLSILSDILDLSKIESGSLELEIRPFCLLECLQETVSLFRMATLEKGLKLSTDWGTLDASAWYTGDSLRLRQVLSNFISNAIKFTEQGEISIQLHWPAPGMAEIRVQDSGTGVPADKLNRLFLPFSQADASISRRYGGTGLGLAICRQLAVLQGGWIWMQSQGGHAGMVPPDFSARPPQAGSTFYFRWPLPPVEVPSRGLSQTVQLPPQLSVLVAEDNAVNRRVIAAMLEKLGYQPKLVADGEQAVAACSESSFQVLFMDLQMPVLDGLSATRRIREMNLTEPPWIIALTANAFREDREISAAAGMDDFLSKPVRQQDVEEALRRFTARARKPEG